MLRCKLPIIVITLSFLVIFLKSVKYGREVVTLFSELGLQSGLLRHTCFSLCSSTTVIFKNLCPGTWSGSECT
jgi:hypothetical protein